jgi:LPPG:FO 2-phospho-L-lactate transferase
VTALDSGILVLTGGTGGAKLVRGLERALGGAALGVIVNTGDDLTCWGLRVSPDIDSVTYALADLLSRERGWGIEGDTFQCLDQMRRLGAPAWFQLGDRDLALHLTRTELLREGKTLTETTAEIAKAFGISARILPMSDDAVETRVLTTEGELSFQEYFVRERFRPQVKSVRFIGAENATPAPGVLAGIASAAAVVIAPSNPITSIGPILAVPGIRDALRWTDAPVIAVSPIVAGAAVSGPAGDLMKAAGLPVSLEGIALAYADFLDVLVADSQDVGAHVSDSQIELLFTDTIMRTDDDKLRLAQFIIAVAMDRHRKVMVG